MSRADRNLEPASNIEWKHWAKSDPLFAVVDVEGRDTNGSNPWTNPDFFESGAWSWADYRAAWERYGVHNDSCLEIGCGAGRITQQLLKYFGEVAAIDISPEMITFASRHVPGANYMICDGQSVGCRDNQFTAAFSSHVFQHFENRETATAYFGELFRVLKPGGTMMIHVPIAILPFRRVWPVMGAIQVFLCRRAIAG